jgi:hypothetical protein
MSDFHMTLLALINLKAKAALNTQKAFNQE